MKKPSRYGFLKHHINILKTFSNYLYIMDDGDFVLFAFLRLGYLFLHFVPCSLDFDYWFYNYLQTNKADANISPKVGLRMCLTYKEMQ